MPVHRFDHFSLAPRPPRSSSTPALFWTARPQPLPPGLCHCFRPARATTPNVPACPACRRHHNPGVPPPQAFCHSRTVVFTCRPHQPGPSVPSPLLLLLAPLQSNACLIFGLDLLGANEYFVGSWHSPGSDDEFNLFGLVRILRPIHIASSHTMVVLARASVSRCPKPASAAKPATPSGSHATYPFPLSFSFSPCQRG